MICKPFDASDHSFFFFLFDVFLEKKKQQSPTDQFVFIFALVVFGFWYCIYRDLAWRTHQLKGVQYSNEMFDHWGKMVDQFESIFLFFKKYDLCNPKADDAFLIPCEPSVRQRC